MTSIDSYVMMWEEEECRTHGKHLVEASAEGQAFTKLMTEHWPRASLHETRSHFREVSSHSLALFCIFCPRTVKRVYT